MTIGTSSNVRANALAMPVLIPDIIKLILILEEILVRQQTRMSRNGVRASKPLCLGSHRHPHDLRALGRLSRKAAWDPGPVVTGQAERRELVL